ncbi:hypothetical protein PGTUg99_007041 [Puccinia graminis f. sp. tritici]|uniref:Uncharacterized protein n=1 Tax=Puccinia graminis f. sp. tritici TaxID=56615 RepID=A0A5B0NR49_PUCGR|nr:hypothetical protein PGTUg99_007041 [Puccinia graminis f. sp. tritici]
MFSHSAPRIYLRSSVPFLVEICSPTPLLCSIPDATVHMYLRPRFNLNPSRIFLNSDPLFTRKPKVAKKPNQESKKKRKKKYGTAARVVIALAGTISPIAVPFTLSKSPHHLLANPILVLIALTVTRFILYLQLASVLSKLYKLYLAVQINLTSHHYSGLYHCPWTDQNPKPCRHPPFLLRPSRLPPAYLTTPPSTCRSRYPSKNHWVRLSTNADVVATLLPCYPLVVAIPSSSLSPRRRYPLAVAIPSPSLSPPSSVIQ